MDGGVYDRFGNEFGGRLVARRAGDDARCTAQGVGYALSLVHLAPMDSRRHDRGSGRPENLSIRR